MGEEVGVRGMDVRFVGKAWRMGEDAFFVGGGSVERAGCVESEVVVRCEGARARG